jgi:hypothetical protein
MSQADIDTFAYSAAWNGALTPEGVVVAVETRGIPVNGRSSACGLTALQYAVISKRRELVIALLAAGADPNVKDPDGRTSVCAAAIHNTADILQLLIDGGGSVNEADNVGRTPLIYMLVRGSINVYTGARLQMLLASPVLDLDAKYKGKTAEEWAVTEGRPELAGHPELAAAIAEEQRRRMRWSALRSTWIDATVAPVAALL